MPSASKVHRYSLPSLLFRLNHPELAVLQQSMDAALEAMTVSWLKLCSSIVCPENTVYCINVLSSLKEYRHIKHESDMYSNSEGPSTRTRKMKTIFPLSILTFQKSHVHWSYLCWWKREAGCRLCSWLLSGRKYSNWGTTKVQSETGDFFARRSYYWK